MKKHTQLGMNASTASNRLVKDLLFHYAVAHGHKCFRCGIELTRDAFSIEHIEPWLDSDDPVGLFFDIENIAFSHTSCNSAAARKPSKLSEDQAILAKEAKRVRTREYMANRYTTEARREKKLKTGH